VPSRTTEPDSALTGREAFAAPGGLLHDPGVVLMFRCMSVAVLSLLSMLTFVLVVFRAIVPLSDPDTWWHLAIGQRFLQGTSIRHPGPLSYFGTEDWRPRDWLTQVVAARFEGWFGLSGVAWLYGFGLVVFAVVVFRLCRARTSFASATVATAICVMASMTSLTPRPQLVSFILLAVTVGALLNTATDLKPRWWLALLTAGWACAHGMWFLGPLLQGVVLVGLLLDRRVARAQAARLSGVILASLAAVAVTPNGLYLLQKPLGTSLAIADYIQEYMPPTVASLYYALTLAMLGLTVLTWARASRPEWVHVALLVVAAGFAVQMQRTTTIGAVIVTPLFAQAVGTWLKRVDLTVPRLLERALVYGGAVVALVAIGLTVPSTADDPSSKLPVAFDAQLDQIPASAVLFNELGDGGFLTWRHPGLRIVEDGLSDQYATDWHIDYFEAGELKPGWQEFLRRTGATYALLGQDHSLTQALELDGWTVTAQDGKKVLLHAPDSSSHRVG
jgi:hypothetical protein